MVANNGSSSVSLLAGVGDGTFRPAMSFSSGSPLTGLVSGDFNGDGLADLAASSPMANNAVVLLAQCK